MTPSLEGWPTKDKEATSPHEVRLALLDTNPVFQSLGGFNITSLLQIFHFAIGAVINSFPKPKDLELVFRVDTTFKLNF